MSKIKEIYFAIEVRERNAKTLRSYFVSNSGSITLNKEEAAKFPEKYEWAVNCLIEYWNKKNRVYEYSKVKVYNVDVEVTINNQTRVCECEAYEQCK